jgi:dephospho-CoA kinase
MAAQAGDEERRAVATFVLDNSADRDDLARQVDEVWAELERMHRQKG